MTIYETNTLRAAQYAALRADSFSFQWLRNGADIGSGSILLAITANPAATVTVTEPAAAVFTAGAQGYTSLLWQQSVTGTGGWANITGATNLTYTIPATDFEIHDGLFYRMSATDGTTTVYTTASALTVNEGGAIIQVPADNYPNGFTVPMGEIWEIMGAITTPKSIEVHGTLKMRAINNPSITFIGVNEQGMIGAKPVGETSGTPVTDVGLWVHEMGNIDFQGTPKTAWTHLAAGAVIGALTITLEAVPTNWNVGDWIVIAPMEAPLVTDDTNTKLAKQTPEERRIKAIAGAVITLGSVANYTVAQGLLKNHPTYTYYDGFVGKAEVLNLTRDVNINGTVGHRSHIMIHSQAPVHCSWFGMNHMGPNNGTDVIIGRWSFHQHLNGDYSRGTVIEGAVCTDSGTHVFVAHGAHGVRHQDCIAHDTADSAFWWDMPGGGFGVSTLTYIEGLAAVDRTADYIGDRCVASFIHYNSAGGNKHLNSGFEMSSGKVDISNKYAPPFPDHRNQFTNCVAFGVDGFSNSAGFLWNNLGPGGTWNLHNCVSHHNRRSQTWWTNVPKNELSTGFRAFHNFNAARNGAYVNDSSWSDSFFEVCTNGVTWEDHAMSLPITFVTDPPYEIFGLGRVITRCVFVASAGNAVMQFELSELPATPGETVKFVDCTFKPGAGAIAAINVRAIVKNSHAAEFIRPTWVLPAGVPEFWFDDQPLTGGTIPYRVSAVVTDDPANLSYVIYDNGVTRYKMWHPTKPGAAAAGYTFYPAWNCWRQTL